MFSNLVQAITKSGRVARRSALVLVAMLLMLLIAGAVAQADGDDPASQALFSQNVFYPPGSAVSPAIRSELNAAAMAGCRARFPIKVALIASPADLGAFFQLFGQPQTYAKYLEQELGAPRQQPLLVVMPSGYGWAGLTPKAARAVSWLNMPVSARPNDLARAARTAVGEIASAGGYSINMSGKGQCSDPISIDNYRNLAIIIAALFGVGGGALVVAIRTRRPKVA